MCRSVLGEADQEVPLPRPFDHDFGLTALTPIQAEDICEVITERHLRSSIITTSNRPPQDWVALFPDPVMANSALDRLAHHAHHVMIDEGESYRKKLSPKTRQ